MREDGGGKTVVNAVGRATELVREAMDEDETGEGHGLSDAGRK